MFGVETKKNKIMRTTVFKFKKIHFWVSGSMNDPYSNLLVSSKSVVHGYKPVNIFPHFYLSYRGYGNNQYKKKLVFYMSSQLPKWFRYLMNTYYHWKRNSWTDEDGKSIKKINFISYLISDLRVIRRMKKCKHLNMVCESDITPDYGSESFYCPDCGYSDHVIYY